MLIRIISGTYGYRPMILASDGSVRMSPYVVPKTPRDPPIEVTDAEAERLVKLGVAEYVDGLPEKMSAVPPVPEKPEDNTSETGDAADAQNGAGNEPAPEEVSEAEDPESSDEPEFSVEMSSADLRAAMEARGLQVKARMTKAQMVEALTAAPELTALDVVDE